MESLPRKRKRLVIVTNNLYAFGGGEKFALDVATRLKNKLDVTVVNTVSKKDKTTVSKAMLAKMFDLSGVEVVEFPSAGIASRAFGTEPYTFRIPGPVSAARLLNLFGNADSIYQVSLNPFLLSYSVLLSKLMKKRFVLGVHNFSLAAAFGDSHKPAGGASARALAALLRQVKFFHVLNDRDLDLIRRRFPKATVKKIPNFVPMRARAVTNNSRKFICLYVGRLEKNQKGIDLLHGAMERTIANDKEVVFHVVGSGGDSEALIADAEKKHPKNVVWSRFLQGKKLEDAYRSASVLVFPSRYDTLSLVLLEAQSFGLPAIAFDIPGPRDIIQESFQGVRIKGLSPEALSTQIMRYHKMWRNGAKYALTKKKISGLVRKKYSAQKLLPELEQFLLG